MRCVILIGVLTCGLAACGPSKEEVAAQEREAEVSGFVLTAKEKTARELVDPSSAQFRDLVYAEHEGRRFVCGEVNGNNRFGAKAGYRAFITGEKLDGSSELAAVFSQDEKTVDAVGPCRAAWAELTAATRGTPEYAVALEKGAALNCMLPNFDADFWTGHDEICKAGQPVDEEGPDRP